MRTTRYAPALALGLIALMTPSVARADTIGASNNSYTMTEGSSIGGVWTFTNNSSTPIYLTQVSSAVGAPPSGDLTDNAFTFESPAGTCYNFDAIKSLAVGASCTVTFLIKSAADTGETDNDFGITEIGLTATFTNGAGQTVSGTGFIDVTVTDPPPSAVPEPSSISLMGTGLLGLMGMIMLRRRLA